MLFGGRYVPKKEIFSSPNVPALGEPEQNKVNVIISNETPYPYPTRKPSKNVPSFRVNSVLRSLNVNPEPLFHTKTPMELHRARIRITENEIGHSLNEASKKFFGNTVPLPIKNRSFIPHSHAKLHGGIDFNNTTTRRHVPILKKNNQFENNEDNYEDEDEDEGEENLVVPTTTHVTKQRSFAIRKEIYPAVVLLKTSPIAPLRLRSPLPQPKYSRRPLEPPRLEDLNVINGYTHINTDGRHETNTFAPTLPKKHHRQDGLGRDQVRLGAGNGRFHAEIDLNGFHEDEIFFQTDDSSLLVVGLRQKRDGLNARKVTEVLEFPEGVYPESLCISRTTNGTLIMEQHF